MLKFVRQDPLLATDINVSVGEISGRILCRFKLGDAQVFLDRGDLMALALRLEQADKAMRRLEKERA